MSEPEHISSILARTIKALAEEWKKQNEEREVQFDPDSQRDFDELEIRGVSGFGWPGTHAARSPFPLAWGEVNGRRLDKAISESKAVSGL